MSDHKKCEELVDAKMQSRIEDFAKLTGDEDQQRSLAIEDYGFILEEGDELDSCELFHTMILHWDQESGMLQLSTGGPGDHFIFGPNGDGEGPYPITYHYRDWFDGADRVCRGRAYEVMLSVWQSFLGHC